MGARNAPGKEIQVPQKAKTATVTWIDAAVRASVHGTLQDCIEKSVLSPGERVGYLLFWDDERLVLAADYDAEDTDSGKPEYGETITIPSGWVKKVKIGGRLVTREAFNEHKEGQRTGVAEVPEHPVSPS